MKSNPVYFKAAFFMFSFCIFSASSVADDVTESINEGMKNYKDGKLSDAVVSLNYAAQLIQQKKGVSLEAFLPAPLSGWSAKDAKSQAVGAAMLGGGVNVKRTYSKGTSKVTVEIITDSPMLQGVMMMFSNPMFATSDGGKLEKINGEKAIVKYRPDARRGEIQLVIVNRYLITIKGRTVSEEELKAYAGLIDYKKIAELQ